MSRVQLALRLFIGVVLAITAAGKLLDLGGFAGIVRSYEVLPQPLVLPVALAIPLAEALLAMWLFTGRHLAAASASALAMHLLYAGWAAAAILRGLRLENCGCFGVFLARPLSWRTVGEDLVLAGLSAGLFALARRPR